MRNRTILLGLMFLLAGCAEDVRPPDIVTWQYYRKINGLASDDVYALLEEKSGKIWFGTNKGATVYDGSKYTSYSKLTGMIDDFVNTVAQAANDDVWFGTAKGVSVFTKAGQWLVFSPLNGITVNSIIRDSNGLIWIATSGYGIVKYNYTSQTFTQTLDNTCSICNTVNVLFEDKDKQVWAGSNGDVKMYKGTSPAQSFTDVKNGIAGKSIWSVGQDSWGNIWFGSSDHVNVTRYRNGSFAKVSLANNPVPASNWVLDIQEDNQGQLWFGVVVNGLIQYDGAVMHKQFTGPPTDNITSLMKDSKGNMWVATIGGGVGRFTPIRKSP